MRRLPLRSPPRMRGKDGVNDSAQAVTGITPACAGKSLSFWPIRFSKWDPPRVCGEKSPQARMVQYRQGSPPRMRGKVDADCTEALRFGITPACAGKSVKVNEPDCLPRDHPRVCGEKVSSTSPIKCLKGSPPRMRGKGALVTVERVKTRITPAYAGKRKSPLAAMWLTGDHPRVCGEKTKKIP